jgi:hypothetical protein
VEWTEDAPSFKAGPSKREISYYINALRNKVTPVPPAGLADVTRRALRGYATAQLIIEDDFVVFRARVRSAGEEHTNVLDVWGPQSHHVKKRGRFNEAADPRLYCASNATAAFVEARPEPGDHVSLIVATKVDPAASLKFVPLGIARYAYAETIGLKTGEKVNAELLAMLREAGLLEHWMEQDDYLADITTEYHDQDNEHGGYARSIIAGRMFENVPGTSGLVYPSVASWQTGLNFCIPGAEADRAFYPLEVWDMRVDDGWPDYVDPDGRRTHMPLEVQRASRSIAPDGTIDWCDRSHFNLYQIDDAHNRLIEGRHVRNGVPSFERLRAINGRELEP